MVRSSQWPVTRGSTTAGWARSAAPSLLSCSATRSIRSPASPIPTSRCWSTAPCKAGTTSARRSNPSWPGRRCTAASSGPRRSMSTRASTSSSRSPTTCVHRACGACSRTPPTCAPSSRRSTARSASSQPWPSAATHSSTGWVRSSGRSTSTTRRSTRRSKGCRR